MKLNHECVRNLLLTIEDKESQEYLFIKELKEKPKLHCYSDDEILYAGIKLMEAQYIHAQTLRGDNRIFDIGITDLTWEGHNFLDNIRDNVVWSETKTIAKKVSGTSLQILSDIAKGLIVKHLGL